MGVQTFTIKRFKRLQEVALNLADEVTMIVGTNNCGKSSALQGMHFAVSLAQSVFALQDPQWNDDKYTVTIAPAQLFYSPSGDAMTLATGGNLTQDITERIEFHFLMHDGETARITVRRGRNQNLMIAFEGRTLTEKLADLGQPFSIYVPGLSGIAKDELRVSSGRLRRFVARGDANLVVRNVLANIDGNAADREQFVADMRQIFPDFDFNVPYEDTTDEFLDVEVTLGGPWLPLESAGTGVLQTAQLVGYITLFKPRVLILDEPDAHIHPNNQRKLCALLQRLANERDFQVLLSTHSRHVIDAVGQRGNLVWMSGGAVVEGPSLNTTSMLMDLGALDSIDYFADGHLRCLVATEDTDKTYLENLLWSAGFEEAETEVLSYNGCTKVDSAAIFSAFLRTKAPNVKIVIHRDSDYMLPDEATTLRTQLQNLQVELFLTERSDIEAYYVNRDHLLALNPSFDAATVDQLIQDSLQETRDATIADIVNLRVESARRRQKDTGVAPNSGVLAVQAPLDYNANPLSMHRGKRVLKVLRAKLQAMYGPPVRVLGITPHLAPQDLKDMANVIWP